MRLTDQKPMESAETAQLGRHHTNPILMWIWYAALTPYQIIHVGAYAHHNWPVVGHRGRLVLVCPVRMAIVLTAGGVAFSFAFTGDARRLHGRHP
jgi:hypothetical protein